MGSQSWFVVMLLVFAAWLPAALAADDVHEGKVIGVTASSITLLDDKDNQFDKFEVNAETKVTRNGKPHGSRTCRQATVAASPPPSATSDCSRSQSKQPAPQ